MQNSIWIITAAIIKVLLCKLLELGIVLLVLFVKGKQLDFNSERWDEYFLTMTDRKLDRFVIANYTISAILSGFASFMFLHWVKVPGAAVLTVILFAVGGAISGYRYFTKERAYIRKRCMEIPQTILRRREETI